MELRDGHSSDLLFGWGHSLAVLSFVRVGTLGLPVSTVLALDSTPQIRGPKTDWRSGWHIVHNVANGN